MPMPIMPTPKSKTFDLEKSLSKLESIVDALENGDLSLEQSLKQFEEGVGLTRACQEALVQAEQKIQVLVEKAGQATLEPLDNPDV